MAVTERRKRSRDESPLMNGDDARKLGGEIRGLNMTLVRLEGKLDQFVEAQQQFIRDVHQALAAQRKQKDDDV